MLNKVSKKLKQLTKSIWLFPAIVGVVFSLLIAFGINGSSIGVYNGAFYGAQNDPNLILGTPRPIRSDEWIVMTQMIIAQKEAGYPSVNENIGSGENMNIILDVPTTDWSQIFRPQNWAFTVLPFENAFAYRWWFTGVVLVLAVYFLSLFFMPKRRLLAALLGLGIFFSGFTQWWYISSTLACLAYPLVIFLLYAKLLHNKITSQKIFICAGLVYSLVGFALILYPPFQIPTALVIAIIALGYTASRIRSKAAWRQFTRHYLGYLLVSLVIVIGIIGAYLYQNRSVVEIVQQTSYPGKRIVESGDYSIRHLMSGTLAFQFLQTTTANSYNDQTAHISNQSEASTFIFTSIFLAPYAIYLLSRRSKYRIKNVLSIRYAPLIFSLVIAYAILLAWLFIPGLSSTLGSITKLDMVPSNRAIIGLGLLNTISLIFFFFFYERLTMPKSIIHFKAPLVVAGLSLIAILAVHSSIKLDMPQFVSWTRVILLSLPVPFAIFLMVRKRFVAGFAVLLLFSIVSTALVNPLYKGLGAVLSNELSSAIDYRKMDGTYWISEDSTFENIAVMNNRKSLSGVFSYPQKSLWSSIPSDKGDYYYNRYAHVNFNFDKDPTIQEVPQFMPTIADHLLIKSELCSEFIKESRVRHIISSWQYSQLDQTCISNTTPVRTQTKQYYVYDLAF